MAKTNRMTDLCLSVLEEYQFLLNLLEYRQYILLSFGVLLDENSSRLFFCRGFGVNKTKKEGHKIHDHISITLRIMMFKAFPTVLLLVCLCTEVAARLQVVRVDDYIDANDESSKALKQESFDILLQEDSNS